MIHCSVILVPYGSGFGVEPERKLVRSTSVSTVISCGGIFSLGLSSLESTVVHYSSWYELDGALFLFLSLSVLQEQ